MSYQVIAYRVLIASPSDTTEERTALVHAMHEWNDLNMAGFGVVLVPTLWEVSVSPELGERAQAIINRELVDESDILVGTFWTRLGTPTGDSRSGTVEEIDRFRAYGRPTLLYFSEQPVAPASIAPDQLQGVHDYRTEMSKHGLVVRRGFGFGEGGAASADLGDDLFGCLGPRELGGVVVVVLGPGLDRFDEHGDAVERPAA